MNFVHIRRLSDGATMEVPERDLAETLKRGFEVIGNTTINQGVPELEEFGCPICDKTFKTEQGLKVHKSKHK